MSVVQHLAERVAQPFLLSWGWRRFILSLFAGAFASCAMPPFGAWPVLFLSLPVLVLLLDTSVVVERTGVWARYSSFFFTLWWFYLGFFIAGMWWIAEAFLIEASKYAWMIPFAVLGLPAVLATLSAAISALVAPLWRQGPRRVLLLAIALALSDFVRAYAFTGFPWNLIGLSFSNNVYLLQSASVFGVFGQSLVAAFVCATPAVLISDNKGQARAVLTLSVVSLFSLWGFGFWHLQQTGKLAQELKVVVVQPNIAQTDKWKPENRDKLLPGYLKQTKAALASLDRQAKTLVVWPESAFPFLLARTPDAQAAIGDVLHENAYLMTGALRADVSDGTTRFFNSVYTLNGDGAILQSYDKVRLVPFGEFLPFHNLLSRLGIEKLVNAPSDFTAGQEYKTLGLPNGWLAQPLVCYEAIFPQTMMALESRPQLLVNTTNDAWFGASVGPAQHLAQARLRAVEQGVPMVRAANTGISAIIDANGIISSEIPMNLSETIVGNLSSIHQPTLYARYGNYNFLFLLLVFISLYLVLGRVLPTRLD
ncbi:apolipoprotein N-acyltransferase [Polycladidibacter hongkongensis]|uniref:apolipoprotein N-acyltransferase n=1 Tax=Polycladidibacter hongkongensis TaxID=1647556 RepID=UPI00082A1593|nr:apolipoprotein N-acyltransferase [Pseudovibrio hongkongensis]